MAKVAVKGKGTPRDLWVLKTPTGTSEYKMYRYETSDPPALLCIVGATKLSYHLRCIEDLHAMLKKHGDWMFLGSADEQKPAAEGAVEAWARSPKNPAGGWYGLKKGLRRRFAMHIPPSMELWKRWGRRRSSIKQRTTACALPDIFLDTSVWPGGSSGGRWIASVSYVIRFTTSDSKGNRVCCALPWVAVLWLALVRWKGIRRCNKDDMQVLIEWSVG